QWVTNLSPSTTVRTSRRMASDHSKMEPKGLTLSHAVRAPHCDAALARLSAWKGRARCVGAYPRLPSSSPAQSTDRHHLVRPKVEFHSTSISRCPQSFPFGQQESRTFWSPNQALAEGLAAGVLGRLANALCAVPLLMPVSSVMS